MGFTFRFTCSGFDELEHIHVVISKTDQIDIVVVNFTTCRQFSDESCIILPGEHECAPHKTCIAYQYAKKMPVAQLARMIERGDVDPRRPVSRDLLARIWDGAQKTPHLPIGLKRMLQEQNIIEDW